MFVILGIFFFFVLLLTATKITIETIAVAFLIGLVPGLLLALASR